MGAIDHGCQNCPGAVIPNPPHFTRDGANDLLGRGHCDLQTGFWHLVSFVICISIANGRQGQCKTVPIYGQMYPAVIKRWDGSITDTDKLVSSDHSRHCLGWHFHGDLNRA